MKPAFRAYLESVGIVGALLERVDAIIRFYESLPAQEILQIFVSEYVKEDGSREYEALWFFSMNFMMEAKGFVRGDDFDMAPIAGRVSYWRIQKSDYDFVRATEKSRLNVYFSTSGVNGNLKHRKRTVTI